MLVSSIGVTRASTPDIAAASSLAQALNQSAPSFNPYLENTSWTPNPDELPNVTGNVSLPQISSVQVGSTSLYVLVFVSPWQMHGSVLEFDIGSYSPSAASAIMEGGGCTRSCHQHVPIDWNTPTPVAIYGSTPITGDALSVVQGNQQFTSPNVTAVYVAAASNGSTNLYASQSLGASDSWYAVNGEQSISGASPRIAVSPETCSVSVVTETPKSTLVTTFEKVCQIASFLAPPSGGGPGGGGGKQTVVTPPGSPAGPEVYGVVPYEAPIGYPELSVEGVGFTAVQSVVFGSTAATYSVRSPELIMATVPAGSGLTHVQVESAGLWSPTNCSNQFLYGPALAAGTPQVSWVTPSSAQVGGPVSIYGYNLQSGDTVSFGPSRVSATLTSPTTLSASVPPGQGTVNVTVTSPGGLTSPTTCADLFHYVGPYLLSLAPNVGYSPMVVNLQGLNFTSSAVVDFGSTPALSVKYLSSTQLQATVPPGSGTVPVTVHQSGFASNSLSFQYVVPGPVVNFVDPDNGPPGANITLVGGNFTSSAQVLFGTLPSPSVHVVSAQRIYALAPPVSGTVNVTVVEPSGGSPTVCTDEFSYSPIVYPPLVSPFLNSFSSYRGVSGSMITLYGVDFLPQDRVYFGPMLSPYVNSTLSNTTELTVEVPLGVGNVSLDVTPPGGGLFSPVNCLDRFDIVSPGDPPLNQTVERTSVTLPVLTSAAPVYWGLLEVMGTTPSGEITQYALNATAIVSTSTVAQAAESLGSSIFTSAGDTELTMPGGAAAQVAAVASSAGLFVMATADQLGRTVIETLVWNGINWSQPYFVTPSEGSASDPQLAVAPWGDVYATWVDGVSGSDGLDEAAFTPAGVLLQGPTLLTGSSGTATEPRSVSAPSLTVDPMGHPVAAWESSSSSGSEIAYTGAYVSPANLSTLLQAAWSKMTPSDFEDFGGPGRTTFEARVNATLANVSAELAGSSWCAAARNVSSAVYTNVTWLANPPLVYNTAFDTSCRVSVGTRINTIVTETYGPLTADVYLSVETEWLMEALGVGTMPVPDWDGFDYASHGNAAWYQPDKGGSETDRYGSSVTVSPETTGPNTLLLATYGTFPGDSNLTTNGCVSSGETDAPASYHLAAQVKDGHGSQSATFTTPTYLPFPTFTDIYPDENGTWMVWANVTFQTDAVYEDWCGSSNEDAESIVATPAGWPTEANLTVGGTFTTGLDPYPAQLHLFANSTGTQSTTSDSLAWRNTVDSDALLKLNGTSAGVTWTDANYTPQDRAQGGVLAASPSPLKSMEFELQTNNTPPTWQPQVNMQEVSQPSPIQTFVEGCTISGSTSVKTWTGGTSHGVSNLTSSSATLTWNSSKNSTGWVELREVSGGTVNLTGQVLTLPNGTAYEYIAEARGLDSWAVYNVTYFVSASASCKTASGSTMASISVNSQLAGGLFEVPGAADLFEQDAPYDSITHQGGGATVAWQVPTSFVEQKGTKFLNGTLDLTSSNSSAAAFVVPLSSLTPFTNYSQFGTKLRNASATTYAVNVTGLSLNNEYTATVVLNYSTPVNPHFQGTGSHSFWYEKDSSGDGLTDWEKGYGWEVTTTGLNGAVTNQHVTANVQEFATNGLVGDYVEKEYGLNPNTVDSANSGMLDTWNLTFNLAPGGSALPSGSDFAIWYENSTYKPFASSVQYSPGLFESGNPVQKNITNISASGGLTSGDGAPWAARALWSYSALETFVGLSGVANAGWLRAIEGSWDGLSTLTVEGKLSWGANPLAASTPNDGIQDGARVNPLYDVGLEFHSVDANQSSLGTGTGYAVWIGESYESDSGAERHVSNYSSQGLVGNATVPTVSNYVTTLPVSQTQRTQTLSLEVVANESGGLTAVPINGSQTEVSVSYDLVKGTPVTVRVSGSGSGGRSNLFGVFQEVPMGTKAPTWLWVPTDNATVNDLPIGLQRYTGEQSFDLVVVNASASVTSDSIPLPWGGTARGITLSAGMNDILVPREQFLYSPLGQAIFLGKNTSYNASAGAPPLVGSTEQGYITGFDGSNLMVDLGAYWQNRAITSGPGNITGSTETGTPAGNPLEVQVMAASSATSDNTGGLPSDPALYSTVGDPSALQSIITLNITSTPTLDLLLAALIDNTTGGAYAVNGTLESVTYQVGFLGLNGAVVNAISNATEPNDGLYGAPASHFPPPPPPSGWGAFWNAVTSFVTNPLGTVLSLVSVVWNAATAAFTYLNHLAHEAVAIGAQVLARTATAIVHVGQMIAKALYEFLSWIIQEITKLLGPIVAPLTTAMTSWGESLWSNFQSLWSEYNSSPSDINSGLAATFVEGLFGNLFDVLLGISVAVAVALTMIQVIGLGAGEIVSILVSLIPPPSEVAGYALSAALIPASYFSTGIVRAGWAIYNNTTKVVSPFFAPLLAIVGDGIGALKLLSDVPEAIETVEALAQGAAPYIMVVFEPIVAAVTGLLSIALDIVGHILAGLEGAFLETVGEIVSGAGALFSLFVIVRYWEDLKDALQLNQQIIGSGLDAIGLAAGLGELRFGS